MIDHTHSLREHATPCRHAIGRRAFTSVEMLVVMFGIVLMMGGTVPGICSALKRYNENSTVSVFQAVHGSCLSNARQFGSACLIYGYTLDYNDVSVIPGRNTATSIIPWIISESNAPQYQSDLDLRSEIGHSTLWNGDRIEFEDAVRPSVQVIKNGAAISTTTDRYLHVAFEPRSGFIHVVMSNSSTPAFSAYGAGGITGAASIPDDLVIELWHLLANSASRSTRILVRPTGVIDVRSP